MIKVLLLSLLVMNGAWAQEKKPDLSPAESKLMKTEGVRLWQKRDDQQSLEESLSKFEQALAGSPQDIEILTYLTRGYFLLADLHLDNKDLKMKNYEKAKAFGESGLSSNAEYKKKKDSDIKSAIGALTKNEVPLIFWTAAALGKWSKLNGVMSSLKYKDQILSMIKRVEALEPNYFHGAVPRYWGGFYAVAPRIAGGDMKKSKKNFQRAIEAAPDYLGSHVLFAELYWTEEGNKKEFEKELKLVIAAPNGPEEIRPENMLEKKKAEKLLEKADDLF